jgi:hypothetical protein
MMASLWLANSAQADMVAGWDFSQYAGDGTLITDSGTFAYTNRLDSNYSDLTPNPGPSAAGFGTLLFDGTAGSTDVTPGLGADILPTQLPSGTGSLASNLTAPANDNFDSLTSLAAFGQDFTEYLALTPSTGLSIVFSADVSSQATAFQDWAISLAAKTFSGIADLEVEFSLDGSNYNFVDSLSLTDVDTLYSVNLPALGSDAAYIRLNFDAPLGGGDGQAVIDNVAVFASAVPEPGTGLLVSAGLAGLAAYGRRRRA